MCILNKLKNKLHTKNLKDFLAQYKYIAYFQITDTKKNMTYFRRHKESLSIADTLYCSKSNAYFADTKCSSQWTKKISKNAYGLLFGYESLQNMQSSLAILARLGLQFQHNPKAFQSMQLVNPESITLKDNKLLRANLGLSHNNTLWPYMICLGALCDTEQINSINCLRLTQIDISSQGQNLVFGLNGNMRHMLFSMCFPKTRVFQLLNVLRQIK